jgi:hypothetical protein
LPLSQSLPQPQPQLVTSMPNGVNASQPSPQIANMVQMTTTPPLSQPSTSFAGIEPQRSSLW